MVQNINNDQDLENVLTFPISWDFLRDSTVLITGSTGKIGKFLAQTIIYADKLYELNIKLILPVRDINKAHKIFADHATLVPYDFESENISNIKSDFIFHCAAQADAGQFCLKPYETYWQNIVGTKNIIQYAVASDAKKILFVSSAEVYGEYDSLNPIKVREDDIGILDYSVGKNSYAASKRAGESLFAYASDQYHFDYCVVRLAHTLGKNMSLETKTAYAEFAKCVKIGCKILLKSNGSTVKTYSYVSDVVGGLLMAFCNGESGFYNIANENNVISMMELAKMMKSFDTSGKVQIEMRGGTANRQNPGRCLSAAS